jgi:signal transduction histidine kinase
VEISISDNGIGIKREKLKELFISTHMTSYGTETEKGLGLVLCKEFIERHKVKFGLKEEGKGSDFKFMLPLNNPYA